MVGIQRVDVFITLTQTPLRINGFGQDHSLRQSENIDSVNKSSKRTPSQLR